MKYSSYGYIWPPRPEQAIPTSLLTRYENDGWVAQVKKNGTCTVVFANSNEVIFKTRHNDDHKAWKPLSKHETFFKKLVKTGWCVFVCELLHSKGGGTRDTLYIFDIIVWQGEYLTKTTFADRQKLLSDIFSEMIIDGQIDHSVIGDGIWLAKIISKDFLDYWNILDSSSSNEDEGLVLKNPNATLNLCNKASSNSGWQIKCRREHKNYSF
jgi:hypothetical protein